jgi:hypothetical protein
MHLDCGWGPGWQRPGLFSLVTRGVLVVDKAWRQCRRAGFVGWIAIRARHASGAAVAGIITKPRAIGMTLADP